VLPSPWQRCSRAGHNRSLAWITKM